jgi:glucose-1-phosphatase
MPTNFLYFDLGKVILEFSHERMCNQMAEASQTTTDVVRSFVFGDPESLAALIRYETGHISTDEFFDEFCRITKTSPNREQLAMAAADIFSPIEPMQRLLAKLAAAGNRMAILSNTNPVQWEHLVAGQFPVVAFGKPTCAFQWAILSYQVGVMKPEPGIYTAAIEKAGVEPREIFFTDDRLENIEGAKALGIDAVQFVDAEQLAADLRARGVLGAFAREKI